MNGTIFLRSTDVPDENWNNHCIEIKEYGLSVQYCIVVNTGYADIKHSVLTYFKGAIFGE